MGPGDAGGQDATFVLAEQGIRTEVILKADIRRGART